MTTPKEILKAIKNHWLIISTSILFIVTSQWLIGCQAQTQSLLFPDKRVTRAELESEIEMWLATAKRRIGDLDKQEEIRNFLLTQASTITSGGAVNPSAMIGQLLAIFLTGTVAYNAGQKKSIVKTTEPKDSA